MAAPTPSDRGLTTVPARSQEKGQYCEIGTVTFTATGAGDVSAICNVEAGTTVVDAYVLIPVSLGASTTITLGDGADADRYVTATTAATAGYFRMNNVAAGPFTYTTDDTIDIVLAGGTATGVVKVFISFTREAVDLA